MKIRVERDTCGNRTCFVAYDDDLPGCMAQGNTRREAIKALDEARQLYITASLAHGLTIAK